MNTVIKEREVVIHEPLDKTFEFLSHPRNFNSLMPPEVKKFEAGEDWFLFALGAMPEVKMKLSEVKPNELIKLRSASDKLDFELLCHFKQHEDHAHAWLEFQGQFNMMMKMMVEKPLKAFLKTLTDNLEKL
ncbi:MAG: SRPBCC family protein [Schleiferiaceae bacterium]|jgi:hypothetical protein|nr:SRPBCC family protein [Schleiferiaceae bacterium]